MQSQSLSVFPKRTPLAESSSRSRQMSVSESADTPCSHRVDTLELRFSHAFAPLSGPQRKEQGFGQNVLPCALLGAVPLIGPAITSSFGSRVAEYSDNKKLGKLGMAGGVLGLGLQVAAIATPIGLPLFLAGMGLSAIANGIQATEYSESNARHGALKKLEEFPASYKASMGSRAYENLLRRLKEVRRR